MFLDKKEIQMLNDFKKDLEQLLFDENTIYRLLIFIREHIKDEECEAVMELCHLVAHRRRNRGRVCDSIYNAYINNFALNEQGRVKGSKGIYQEDWEKEWRRIFELFDIKYSDRLLRELTLCVICMANEAQFETESVTGTVVLIVDKEGNVDLDYKINMPKSKNVVFLKSGPWPFLKNCPYVEFEKPPKAVRDNGSLRLICEDNS